MRGFIVSFGIHAAGVLGLAALPSFSASELPPVRQPPPPPLVAPTPVRLHTVAPPVLPARRQQGGGGEATQPPIVKPRSTEPTAISEEELRNDESEPAAGHGAGEGPPEQDSIPGLGPLPLAGTNPEAPSLVRAHVDVRPPRKLAGADPVYPPLARAARVEGTVVLECTIGTDGRVGTIRVLRGHPLLNAAAVDGVTAWSYTPTLLNGVPVSVLMTVTVEFKLSR